MDDLLETFGYFIIFAIGISALLLFFLMPFAFMSYYGTKYSCDKYGHEVGYQVKFIDNPPWYWSCQVKTPSGWIDYDKIQNINLSTDTN